MEATGPLNGLRVLDLTSVVMGPLCTQMLGDLGADVVVVERFGGDTNRVMGAGPHPELSGISLNLMRNKRSVSIDSSGMISSGAAIRCKWSEWATATERRNSWSMRSPAVRSSCRPRRGADPSIGAMLPC